MPSDILIQPNKGSTTLNPIIFFSGSAANNSIRLETLPSGSVAFLGNSGSLFSIVDSMSGSLMAVSDVSGLPILEVFSDDKVVMGKFNSNAFVVTGSRVGIGKATPNATFDVSGSAIVSGSLSVTGSDAYVQNIRIGRGNQSLDGSTVLGENALSSATGNQNTAIGYAALKNVTSGYLNVGLGYETMTGSAAGQTGYGNIAVGYKTMCGLTSGAQNVAIGYAAAVALASGNGNVLIGTSAGYALSSGGGNVIIGTIAGGSVTTGNQNTILGAQVNPGNVSNTVAIGDGGGNIRIYVDSSGNTALGKTSPINAKLDVSGNAIVTGSITSVLTGGSGGTNVAIRSTAGNSAGYFGNNQYVMSWDNGVSYSHAIKTRHDASILENNAIDFYVWKAGTDAASTIGTQQMVSILGNGVGINKTSANATLDVNGNTIVTGSLTVTGTITGTLGSAQDPDFTPVFMLMGA